MAGVAISHAMFSEPVFAFSEHARQGWGKFLSEFVATFGLVGVIASVRRQPTAVPFAVASYIMSAYWFTASTSFANPAVTVARSLTNTFAGIRAADVPAFLAAQVLGTAAATVLMGWLIPAARTAVPHVVASGSSHPWNARRPRVRSLLSRVSAQFLRLEMNHEMGEGFVERLEPRYQLALAHPLVMLLRPENKAPERPPFG